ncbi:MAG TPA: hypothetical protein VF793_14345 [Telluria sp.]
MHRPLLAALSASVLAPVLLAACGGGGGSAGNSSPAATSSVAAYQFKTPKAGTHLVYAASLVDNLNNTLKRTVTVDVTAVNPDGSFTAHEEDPSHDTVVSGVTNETLYPTDIQYNAAGQQTGATVAQPSGSLQCTFNGGAEGAPGTLASGGSWNSSFFETCGSNPGTAITQSGTLAGIESVTVPAGTYNAYKFVATTTVPMNGITRVETSTIWRDAAGSDSRAVKETLVFSYSGATPPAGSALQVERQLQSAQ